MNVKLLLGGMTLFLSLSPVAYACDPTKRIAKDFNEVMGKATDNRIVVANFHLQVQGCFHSVTLDFYRDGQKVFDMDTYDVTFVPESDHVRLKISTWDRTVDDVGKHKYRVEGKLQLTGP